MRMEIHQQGVLVRKVLVVVDLDLDRVGIVVDLRSSGSMVMVITTHLKHTIHIFPLRTHVQCVTKQSSRQK